MIRSLKITFIGALLIMLCTQAYSANAAQYLERTPRQNERAFSPAVITEGGKMIWLAGHAGLEDATGRNLTGDFDAQARAAFASIERTLKRAGGTLDNIV